MITRASIFLTFAIGIGLTLLPMPSWALWLRPAWLLLLLIYWSMMLPNRVGVGTAWFLGLFIDVLNGTLLGEHALAYTVIIYLASRMSIRLRMSPWLQQTVSILGFVFLYQFIMYCLQGFLNGAPGSRLYWLSSLTSMMIWPWFFVLMRDVQRRFKIS